MRVIIIGGGWAGTAAAIAARKAGAEVCLIEKTDMLLGCGNAGGIMRNNGVPWSSSHHTLSGQHHRGTCS